MSACVVCGGALVPHLRTKRTAGASLVATTTAYGAAPGDIARCTVCGHMQVEPLPAEAQLAEGYATVSEAAYLEEEAGQRATAVRALERIERHVPVGRLCDLGSWVGFLVSQAGRRGWAAVGVEPSAYAARVANERFGADVRVGTLDTIDLSDGGFDAVVMGDVIEHLPDPGAALERARRLLRPEGVVYLALPDAGSRVARVLRARWWSVLPTHVQYFTRPSVARLLDRSGFHLEWLGTAPKAFTVTYYLERLEGYSTPVAAAAVSAARAAGVADRLVWPDFRDRMAVVGRSRP